jgi:chloramphenicol 3-O-phosphotransferase
MLILYTQLLILLTLFSGGIISIISVYAQIENEMIYNRTMFQGPAASCPEGSMLLLNGTCGTQGLAASCPEGSMLLLNGTCGTQGLAASCPEGSMLLLNGTCAVLNGQIDKNNYKKTIANN